MIKMFQEQLISFRVKTSTLKSGLAQQAFACHKTGIALANTHIPIEAIPLIGYISKHFKISTTTYTAEISK